MSYIWENYKEDKQYISGKRICPYIEIFNETDTLVEVNPMIRFSNIFEMLHSKEVKEYIDNQEAMDNVLFHYLAQLDKCKGLSYKQSLIERIREEIDKGYYGCTVKKCWDKLTICDKEIILYEMMHRLQTDNENFFMDAINKLFPLASLCYEKSTNLYYLYVGAQESNYNFDKLELIKQLFWNKKRDLEVVWATHYGIVGVSDAMHINNIQIV